ncbi:MAG TPA: hemerythrin domain-containing protein [Polyangiaceae bacterium]|jgi:hemerythrin superfamily protein|nr:hemerythrin domain-containing protein [Polyangiaceae bacterium]
MAIAIETGRDVVTFLKGQHQQIKELFSEVRVTNGEQRKRAFTELRRLLAMHETAEEEIVHPAARKRLPQGESLVNARLQEENKAKKELSALEELDADSPEFNARLGSLAMDVVAHAEAEERQEFEPLALSLDAEQLVKLRRAVELAERFAPTRPHPGIEAQAANLLVGPFAAMVDRARDLLTGKSTSNP